MKPIVTRNPKSARARIHAARLRQETGPHAFEFIGRSRKRRRCQVCGQEQKYKFQGRRAGWHWWPKAPDRCAKLMVECQECGGHGTTQARCEMCDKPLTTANCSTVDPDTLCSTCEKEIE
jgi:hypothetical protein